MKAPPLAPSARIVGCAAQHARAARKSAERGRRTAIQAAEARAWANPMSGAVGHDGTARREATVPGSVWV